MEPLDIGSSSLGLCPPNEHFNQWLVLCLEPSLRRLRVHVHGPTAPPNNRDEVMSNVVRIQLLLWLFEISTVVGMSLTPHLALAADVPSTAPDAGPHASAPAGPDGRCGPTVRCEPPTIDDWPTSAPAPPGYHWGSRPRFGPIGTGSALFAIPYLVGGFIVTLDYEASAAPDSNLNWLLLPVAGPLIELAYSSSSAASVLLVADGVMQALGMGLIVYGIAWPAPILVRNDFGLVHLLPMPMTLGKAGSGVSLVGTF